jgi:hypothetical protein
MKCYANRVTSRLVNTPTQTPLTASQNGAQYRVFPDQSDGQPDSAQDFKVISSLIFSGGAEGSSAQIVLQGSLDNLNWVDVLPGTVRTEAGTYVEVLDSASVGILPWIRARVVIAGTTAPSILVTADLISTAPFQLSSV